MIQGDQNYHLGLNRWQVLLQCHVLPFNRGHGSTWIHTRIGRRSSWLRLFMMADRRGGCWRSCFVCLAHPRYRSCWIRRFLPVRHITIQCRIKTERETEKKGSIAQTRLFIGINNDSGDITLRRFTRKVFSIKPVLADLDPH